jgi:hypothetical protein
VSGHPEVVVMDIDPDCREVMIPLNLGGGGERLMDPWATWRRWSGVNWQGRDKGWWSVNVQPASASSASALEVGEVR